MSFNTGKTFVMHFGYGNPKYTYYMNGGEIGIKEEEKDLGIYVNASMKFGKQCAEAAKKANKVVGIIKRNFTNFDKEIMINLYKALVRPHLDYCIPVWKPYLKKDIKLLEDVQRRMTKLVPNLKHKSYEERLKVLNLMTVEKRHLRQDMITMYKIIHG